MPSSQKLTWQNAAGLLVRLAAALSLALAACAAPQQAAAPAAPSATTAASPATAPSASTQLDATPRIAIMSAFAPELALLQSRLAQPQRFEVNGVQFTTGTLERQPVVLLLSGVSMVNAAMNTQLLFDRFHVTHLLFSGIAGGVNPALSIGDVVVPARWGQYLEVILLRANAAGQFQQPRHERSSAFAPYGMLQPRDVEVRRAGQSGITSKFWFDADPQMLAVARHMPQVALRACDAAGQCVPEPPRVVVGGNGVSGSAFVDNAAFRRYVFQTFDANVVDMESAACATVAWSNRVPFLAFRSLSDLAGGGAGANEIHTFLNLAAGNSAAVILDFLRAWRQSAATPPQ